MKNRHGNEQTNRKQDGEAVKVEIQAEENGAQSDSTNESQTMAKASEIPRGEKPTPTLEERLEEKTKEANEYFDKWLRLRAEFENYKKRVQKEKSDGLKYANEGLLRAMLPILDNLERAINHGKETSEIGPLLEGVEMIRKEFLNPLNQFAAKPIPAVGEIFDPEKHEAVAQEESEGEANRVISEIQRGYSYHDRLLRPAKVVVSREKANH